MFDLKNKKETLFKKHDMILISCEEIEKSRLLYSKIDSSWYLGLNPSNNFARSSDKFFICKCKLATNGKEVIKILYLELLFGFIILRSQIIDMD